MQVQEGTSLMIIAQAQIQPEGRCGVGRRDHRRAVVNGQNATQQIGSQIDLRPPADAVERLRVPPGHCRVLRVPGETGPLGSQGRRCLNGSRATAPNRQNQPDSSYKRCPPHTSPMPSLS